jgi:hypothetical protein
MSRRDGKPVTKAYLKGLFAFYTVIALVIAGAGVAALTHHHSGVAIAGFVVAALLAFRALLLIGNIKDES